MEEFQRKEDMQNLSQIPVIQTQLKYIGDDIKEFKDALKPLIENVSTFKTEMADVKKDVGWLSTATKSLYGILITIVGGVGVWAIVNTLKR